MVVSQAINRPPFPTKVQHQRIPEISPHQPRNCKRPRPRPRIQPNDTATDIQQPQYSRGKSRVKPQARPSSYQKFLLQAGSTFQRQLSNPDPLIPIRPLHPTGPIGICAHPTRQPIPNPRKTAFHPHPKNLIPGPRLHFPLQPNLKNPNTIPTPLIPTPTPQPLTPQPIPKKDACTTNQPISPQKSPQTPSQ
jgi:hypothetical protein